MNTSLLAAFFLVLCGNIFAQSAESANVLDGHGQRNLRNFRVEYSSTVTLHLNSKTIIPKYNEVILEEKAKVFIAKNIPADIAGTDNGILALGILSLVVVHQRQDQTASPASLWVVLQIEGVVIASDQFDEESFDFEEVAKLSITANDNEFLRLMEPLILPAHDEDKDGESEKKMAITVSVSVLCVVLLLVLGILAFQKHKREKTRNEMHSNTSNDFPSRKEVPPIALSESTRSSENQDDSTVDEKSIYTTGKGSGGASTESPIARPPEGESSEYNFDRVIKWSFSMCSDDSHEFDTRSDHVDPGGRMRYTIENVDDLTIGGDMDIFEDLAVEEHKAPGTAFGRLGVEPLSQHAPISPRSAGNKKLSPAEEEDFDAYVNQLPAPYKYQTREINDDDGGFGV